MLHSHNKRIIYESDDDTNDIQTVTKGEKISSEVKRIICESDDESFDMRGNNHRDVKNPPNSSRSNLKRKSSDDRSRVNTGSRNEDDGESDCQRNMMKARESTARRTRSSLLNSSDDAPRSLRSSKRSEVAVVNDRLPVPDFNLHLTKAAQAESIDSLQSLPLSKTSSAARFRRRKTAQNDKKDIYGVDDEGEMPDNESNSSTSDNDVSHDSQEEKGGGRSDLHGRSSRTSSHAEEHPRSYVTTRSQGDATASRTSSDRNQALSLAKEAEREVLLKKMKRRLSNGESALDAISSSEEEEEEEEEVGKGKPSNGQRRSDSKRKENDSPISRQQSPPHSSGHHQRAGNRSQSSSRSSRPMSGSSAFIRKEVMPERYNSDEDDNEDCLDDFIVGSDEERDDQQRQMEEFAWEKEKRHKRKEKERKRRAEEESKAIRKAEEDRIEADKIELDKMRQLHSETKSRRRKIIVEDDDEGEDGEGGGGVGGAGGGGSAMTPNGPGKALSFATMTSSSDGASSIQGTSSSSSSSSVVDKAYSKEIGSRSGNRIEIVLSSDEEEEKVGLIPDDDVEGEREDVNDSTDEDEDEDEDEVDDEDDEELLDGPMLYRRVDAMRDELEERDEHSISIMKVSPSVLTHAVATLRVLLPTTLHILLMHLGN